LGTAGLSISGKQKSAFKYMKKTVSEKAAHAYSLLFMSYGSIAGEWRDLILMERRSKIVGN
tara:strand:+ start:199 stop:381 length:183 start_codon:yes stop_codon:yes gene_type:complete